MKRTILISGASSGLGQAFLNAYAADSEATIIAIDRAPINIPSSKTSSTIHRLNVDVTSQESISSLVEFLANRPIDLVIHSVGVRGLVPSIENEYPEDVARAETLEAIDTDTMLRTFHINTVGSFMLIRALLPHLRQATKNSGQPAKVIIMGSRMGSMSYNTTGSAYAYRASKAALNAIVKSFSIDVPELVFVVFHPGRVETGLVKCREEGAIDADESVRSMLDLIPTFGPEKSGAYLDRFGEDIGW
jgi:NAD(P)-dependent dehydrogenase (short-subunit alcohol dehydrogenase family)